MDYPLRSYRHPKKLHVVVVFLMITVITVLHYSTTQSLVAYHTFYRELYFIPIIMVSFWYGLAAGFYTAVLVVFLYIPHVFLTWHAQPGVNLGNVFQILVFILVALATGYLSDREKEHQREMLEGQRLTAMGRAAFAMTSELQSVLKNLKELQAAAQPGQDNGFHDRLQKVIERISVLYQTLSHFGPGYETRSKDFVEIASAIERVRAKLAKVSKMSGVGIEAQLAGITGLLRINEEDFIWVIEELTRNGIEHSEPGKVVTIRVRQIEDRYEIAISDQGKGIASENLKKVLVPFYTTKEKGTGLGLSICKKIMRDNGGDIRVDSKPGEGATFTMVFPQASDGR
jgi:signal transduction histidine kinase